MGAHTVDACCADRPRLVSSETNKHHFPLNLFPTLFALLVSNFALSSLTSQIASPSLARPPCTSQVSSFFTRLPPSLNSIKQHTMSSDYDPSFEDLLRETSDIDAASGHTVSSGLS